MSFAASFNWVFENLRVFVIIVATIIYLIKKAAAQKTDQPEKPPERRLPLETQAGDDPDLSRRIREEMIRKINERRTGAGQRPAPPLVALRPAAQPIFQRAEPRAVQNEPPTVTVRIDETELERQRQIAEQRRLIELRRAELAKREELAARNDQKNTLPAATAADLIGDLRDPRRVRRALVLREVLGPPVGLR